MKTTTVGIIGAGAIGQAFAGQLVNAGINVILSNSRGPESLADVVERLGRGARAGTVRQAAEADIVFVSTNWDKTEAALSGISWAGRILIDATNPVLLPGYRLAELGGKNSSQVVTRWAPGRAWSKPSTPCLPEYWLRIRRRRAGVASSLSPETMLMRRRRSSRWPGSWVSQLSI